ncbi:hypothetical protein HY061_01445 [Candidatus Azambacteria bacterium]|nr:hypothetical protein [Candidatus Azambacteria bacterium]
MDKIEIKNVVIKVSKQILRFGLFFGLSSLFIASAIAFGDALASFNSPSPWDYLSRRNDPVIFMIWLSVFLIFLFTTFKCLLPRFSEMVQAKKAWIERVITSLGGLGLSAFFAYSFSHQVIFFNVKFFEAESLEQAMILFSFNYFLSLILAFTSFEYLTHDPTKEDTSKTSIVARLLRNRGKVFIVIFTILFIYLLSGIMTAPPIATEEQTQAQVKKIHETKITIDDVLGKNLPPEPKDPDKTVQGVDANHNGIRDDVELAIFKEYPNSQKTRAVLLQYALTQQMQVTQSIVNKQTVTAVAEEDSRANSCVGDITPRDKDGTRDGRLGQELRRFIEKRHRDTKIRDQATIDFYQGNLGSYTLTDGCDIDINKLPN